MPMNNMGKGNEKNTNRDCEVKTRKKEAPAEYGDTESEDNDMIIIRKETGDRKSIID